MVKNMIKFKNMLYKINGKTSLLKKHEKTLLEIKSLEKEADMSDLSKSEVDILNHIKSLSSGKGLVSFFYLNVVERFLILASITALSFFSVLMFYIGLLSWLEEGLIQSIVFVMFVLSIIFSAVIPIQLYTNLYKAEEEQKRMLDGVRYFSPLIKKAVGLSLKMSVNIDWAHWLLILAARASNENNYFVKKHEGFSNKNDIKTSSGYVVLPTSTNKKSQNKILDKYLDKM